MKRLFVILVSMVLFLSATPPNMFMFKGNIFLSDKLKYPYELYLSRKKNGVIEGKSITYLQQNKKSIAKVKGNFDPVSNVITFKELDVLNEKSEDVALCYMVVRKQNFKVLPNKLIISGYFTSYNDNLNLCGTGKLYLECHEWDNELLRFKINAGKEKRR